MPDSLPNILWYCTDQQRFDTIGALGNPHARTPVLDQLISDGMAFTHAYCQHPICTPMGFFCHIPSPSRELLTHLCRDFHNGFLYHIDNVLYFRFGDGERGADGDMVAFDTIDEAGGSGHEQYPFF